MKTKSLLLVSISLILIMVSGCQTDDDSFESKTNQKNAKLKRVLLYSSADAKEPISIVEEYAYDSLGRISKVSSPMYKNGVMNGISKYDLYEYNSKGQLIKIINYNANINSPSGFINLRNYVYNYSSEGIKEKEYIEFPQISSFEYTLYYYDEKRLIRSDKYDNNNKMENYIEFEYNGLDELIKETSYTPDKEACSITKHAYVNGQNIKTDIYSGKYVEHIREIIRTFDDNNNLIVLESEELMFYSSSMSYVLKFEYYDN